MARLYLTCTLSGFVPADDTSREIWKKFKAGESYRADVVKPRSYRHHKLCMALLALTYQSLPENLAAQFRNFDVFRYAVAKEAGHIRVFFDLKGEETILPGSLSYDALDEVEFTRVFGAMMTVCARVLGTVAPELEAEVSRYADEHYGMTA